MLSALKLADDLRLTQQFSRTYKDKYKYYGLRFYGTLGPENDKDRDGYKIVRYNTGAVPPLDFNPPVNLDDFVIIKTSEQADIPSSLTYEMFIEDTFFAERVRIDSTSEFQISPIPPQLRSIVFNPEGSATSEGGNLLTSDNDKIVLSMGQYRVTIQITPLTGYVKIQ